MKKTTLMICMLCCCAFHAQGEPTMQFRNDFAAGSTGAFCRVDFECYLADGGFKTGGVCWNTTGNPTLDDASTTYLSKTGTSFLCRLTDLQPTTRYYVRPYITTISPEETYYGDAMCIYTIPAGNLTYTNNHNETDDADYTVYNRLEACARQAQQLYYDWTSISKHVWFNYDPGVSTADANYEGWVRFGSSTSYQQTGTMLHELNHAMGSGTRSDWGDLFDSDGKWKGHRANEVAWLITGDSSVYVQQSGVHFWLKNATGSDYAIGINGASEDSGSEFQYIFNCIVTQAFTEDGLPVNSWEYMPTPGFSLKVTSDTTKYYIKPNGEQYGRYTSYLRDNDGTLQLAAYTGRQALADEHAAWLLEYLPADRRYTIKNAATGNYLSVLTNDGNVLVVDRNETDANASLFQLIRTIDGTATDSNGSTTLTTQSFSLVGNPDANLALDFNLSLQPTPIAYSSGKASQQWLFFTQEEALLFDQATGTTALPQHQAADISITGTAGSIHLSNLPADAQLRCFDLTGKCLFSRAAAQGDVHIPVGTKGIYLVCVTSASGQIARKVPVQ